MKENDSNAFQLYRKMLEVLRKEQREINDSNLDKIEYYSAQKAELQRALHELGDGAVPSCGSDEGLELESLLKKITALNKENAESVLNMRNAVMSSIADLHKGKAGFKAYNSDG